MKALEALRRRDCLVLISGPCVIEGEDLALRHAERVVETAARFEIPVIFKSSFDKANRTNKSSFRGPGLEKGLAVLARIKKELGVPVLTDVHTIEQCAPAGAVADILQIPAFLCRQTDLIEAAAATGRPVNIKKGQFLAPEDMKYAVEKAQAAGSAQVSVTERGTTFGYHDLVVDMRALLTLRALDVPVIFDATHSVQRPGAAGGKTGGNRLLAGPLARAAAAVGVDGVYAEVHEEPDRAKSDGPNSLTFELLAQMLAQVTALDRLRRGFVGDPAVF